MHVQLIKIGNSKGIRLSKTILERYQIKDMMEIILEEGHIVLKPVIEPRKGWSEAFQNMHASGDDFLEIDDVFEDEDFEEWK